MRAFNQMQDRLTRFVADRTRVLAAVGHDLRSPLTALRVRAEMVEDDETRDSLIESIEEMQTVAEATLNLAQDLTGAEPPQTIDIRAFLGEFAEDTAEPFDLRVGACREVRLRRNLSEADKRIGNGDHGRKNCERRGAPALSGRRNGLRSGSAFDPAGAGSADSAAQHVLNAHP